MSKPKMMFKTFTMMIGMIIVTVFLILSANGQFDDFSNIVQNIPDPWPPVIGEPYTDLELIDQEWHSFKLSLLKGKVIIVEPIGMSCAAC